MTRSKLDIATERALGVYEDVVDTARMLDTLLSRPLVQAKLTLSQFRVLATLLEHGPQPQLDLTDRHFRTEAGASSTLTVMERRGLIVRRDHEDDKRQRMIHLSPEGHALIGKLFPREARLVRAEMAVLTGREQEALRKLCQKLMEGDPVKFISELRLVEAEEWAPSGESEP